MKRVLFFHPALAPYRVDFFNRFSALCLIKICCLLREPIYQSYGSDNIRQQLKCEVSWLSKGIVILGRAIRFGLGREIREFCPDVIVTSELSQATAYVFFRRLLGAKFRWVMWTDDSAEIIGGWSRFRALTWTIFARRSDAVVVLSDEARRELTKRTGRAHDVFVCPLLADAEEIRARATLALSGSEFDDQRIRIGFVGRLVREKRPDIALDVFLLLGRLNRGMAFAFIGEGALREELEGRAGTAELGSRVRFCGHLSGAGLYREFAGLDVLLLPSEWEPWGAVVDEALALGIPVVCSASCGASSLIIDGVNGYVVSDGRSESYVRGIQLALELVREKEREECGLRPSLQGTGIDVSVGQFGCACGV